MNVAEVVLNPAANRLASGVINPTRGVAGMAGEGMVSSVVQC